MLKARFKEMSKIVNILLTAVSAGISVALVIHLISELDVAAVWLEPLLDVLYIASLAMIWLYFFNLLDTKRFNYWCSVTIGITVLLRDILFRSPMTNYMLDLLSLTLSVLLLCMLTYFYARKDWKSYTKGNLYLIFIVDTLIALVYSIDLIYFEHVGIYFDLVMTEIGIRPAITYGLVACFISEAEEA